MLKKVFIIGLLIIILFISISFSGIIERTNESSFCAKCHVMKPQYLDQIKGGLHNELKCIECHLPHESKISFYSQKLQDGVKDTVIFFSGRFSEKIKASQKNREIIQENCIRCHFQIVSKINVKDRKCWDCHRRITHQMKGIRETLL